MPRVQTSKTGVDYLLATLKEKDRVFSQAALWKIPHTSGREDINLKVGRYRKGPPGSQSLEADQPKSELTLDFDELQVLVSFLQENYEPFKSGERNYVALSKATSPKEASRLRALFANPDRRELIELLVDHDVIPQDLVLGLQHRRRVKAVQQLTEMLARDLPEHNWQGWFKANDWVLGSEYVRVLDERPIDSNNIADYLVEAYDGFLDIVEIKRPGGALRFWATSLDHGNYVPHTDLVKAITQVSNYLFEVEREANSVKFMKRMGGVSTIKPRSVLIFGRSDDWNDRQHEACRILNATFHNLTILTYDHVLKRARRMLGDWPTFVEGPSGKARTSPRTLSDS
jgi:hypothetical protein